MLARPRQQTLCQRARRPLAPDLRENQRDIKHQSANDQVIARDLPDFLRDLFGRKNEIDTAVGGRALRHVGRAVACVAIETGTLQRVFNEFAKSRSLLKSRALSY